MKAGSFELLGAIATLGFSCTLGDPCFLELDGVGLTGDDKIVVIHKAAPCGDAAADLADWGTVDGAVSFPVLPALDGDTATSPEGRDPRTTGRPRAGT